MERAVNRKGRVQANKVHFTGTSLKTKIRFRHVFLKMLSLLWQRIHECIAELLGLKDCDTEYEEENVV
jgi:hypothetical protein